MPDINHTFLNLREQILSCRQCQSDFGFEPHPIVFGNPSAKIMQISQAPSRTVHNTGKPFNDAKMCIRDSGTPVCKKNKISLWKPISFRDMVKGRF